MLLSKRVMCLALCGCVTPLSSLASSSSLAVDCAEQVSAQVHVDSGHPWRPPFGIDRVGAPIVAHAQLSVDRTLLQRRYYFSAYKNEKEIERQPLQITGQASPFYGTARFTTVPDAVVLFAQCGKEGRTEELARQSVKVPDFEAQAVARPDRQINPVDLGAILVPNDWLLLAQGQQAVVEVAAISRTVDRPDARLRAVFDGGKPLEVPLPLEQQKRSTKQIKLPLTASADRAVLHVAVVAGGQILWEKNIRTMIAAKSPQWPKFGAVETKLRYDAPILIREDPNTGANSSLDYSTAWDPNLKDVVVFLPNGSRFVFWRGSSYVPFWAGLHNTGFTYEWLERSEGPDGSGAVKTMASVEPLMDHELRYGRVQIVESTPTRVHVRWSYQSADFQYKTWGEQASEDFYFYPDGFGTRVVTLTAPPGSDFETSEFIILTPQSAYPLEVIPDRVGYLLSLDGIKEELQFPYSRNGQIQPSRPGPSIYRIYQHKEDGDSVVSFSPNDAKFPVVFLGQYDKGEMIAPFYWGTHWPLTRGFKEKMGFDDVSLPTIHSSPAHNSMMTWGREAMGMLAKPFLTSEIDTIDTLGRARRMITRRWAWLIAKTNAADSVVQDWAQSFSLPPSIEVSGARIDDPAYSHERRAMRLVAEAPSIEIKLKPVTHTVNPVFELDGVPSKRLARVTIDGKPLPGDAYAWDGATLWMKASIDSGGARIGLDFE